MGDGVSCHRPMDPTEAISALDAKVIMATMGYYYKANDIAGTNNNDMNELLNNVSGSFKQGLVCCTSTATPAKDYYFISTRNNNFSNRSQKMKIKVVAATPAAAGTFQYFPPEQ